MSVLYVALVAARQQHDDRATLPLEVHPVARSVVDPHLGDAFAHGPDITRVAGGQPLNADQHAGAGVDIAQAVQPPGIDPPSCGLRAYR